MNINKIKNNLIKYSLAFLMLILSSIVFCGLTLADENVPGSEEQGTTEIDVHTHVEQILEAVEPTCQSEGLTEGVICPECREILVVQEKIPALEHVWEEVTEVAPTYTEAGYIIYECSNCHEEKHEQVVRPDGLSSSPSVDGNYYYFHNNKVLNITTVENNSFGWWNVVAGKVEFETTIGMNANGSWYCNKGKVDFTKDGWVDIQGEKLLVSQGRVRTELTSVINSTINGESGWWYVEKGCLKEVDTVAQNSNGWWCIKAGKVDFGFNGVASNEYGDWYIAGGKVDFSKSGVIKAAFNGEDDWWLFKNGRILYEDTVASNSNGWWCIENGKVNFQANKLAHNENGWWYVKNGKVDFGFTGVVSNEYGDWYVVNGKIDFTKTDIINITVNGETAWWYVNEGMIDYKTGIGENAFGTWYLVDGKVDFTKNGIQSFVFSGVQEYMCYVINGRVQMYEGIKQIGADWYYFKDGIINPYDFTVASNNFGWWCIRDGKVDFSFNGMAANENGTWLIKNGKVDFSYSGPYEYNGVTYTILNGCQYRNSSSNMVFFGDSWSDNYMVNASDSYTKMLCQIKNKNEYNFSVSGAGFADEGRNAGNQIIMQVEHAASSMSMKDRLFTTQVVIEGGWNDMNNKVLPGIDKILKGIESVISESIRLFPNATIYLLYGNDYAGKYVHMDEYKEIQDIVIPYIMEKYPNIVVYENFDNVLDRNPEYYTIDQLHPNELGHQIIAHSVAAIMK